jgi:hypothetical protein
MTGIIFNLSASLWFSESSKKGYHYLHKQSQYCSKLDDYLSNSSNTVPSLSSDITKEEIQHPTTNTITYEEIKQQVEAEMQELKQEETQRLRLLHGEPKNS